jgi:hypothetical protein
VGRERRSTRLQQLFAALGGCSLASKDSAVALSADPLARDRAWVSNFHPKSSLLDGMDGNSNLRAFWKWL